MNLRIPLMLGAATFLVAAACEETFPEDYDAVLYSPKDDEARRPGARPPAAREQPAQPGQKASPEDEGPGRRAQPVAGQRAGTNQERAPADKADTSNERLVDLLLERGAPLKVQGARVSGEVKVVEVISDRAFYLEGDEGRRVLAVVREDVPEPDMIDIRAGQTLKLTGLALPQGAVDDLTGALEAETRDAIAKEPAFVAVYWKDIEIRER